MKKLFLFALVITLASCGQNNVTNTNTGTTVSTKTEVVTEKTETTTKEVTVDNKANSTIPMSVTSEKTEVSVEEVVDENAELRERLEKMAEEYAKTQKYTSFAEFEKVTGLNLGNDAEILPEDKSSAGVGVGFVKNDFVLVSVSMGKSGSTEIYQLKDGKMEFVIGGNGDAPVEQCEKFDSLNVPAEFSRVKAQLCNYTR